MNVLEMLQLTLKAHDVEFQSNERIIAIEPGGLVLEPRLFVHRLEKDEALIQLDMIARSPRLDSRVISESIAGFGKSREEAERNAFGKFLTGPFHVLLTALADHVCDTNPASWEEWGSDEDCWSVCTGPLMTQGANPGDDVFSEFYSELRRHFVGMQTRKAHWVRTFVSSFSEQLQPIEVLLDNDPWPEAIELAHKFAWKPMKDYGSMRHFFIALPSA